jgi:hypothetical protein
MVAADFSFLAVAVNRRGDQSDRCCHGVKIRSCPAPGYARLAHMPDDSPTARGAIADLVHGYALAIRRGEATSCPAMFTADGSFEVREGDPRDPASTRRLALSEGRKAVGRYISASTARVRMLPMIHNLIVELDGDRATASSLMVGRAWPDGSEVIGEYADSFYREEGGWLFSSRIYTIFRAGLSDSGQG